MEKQKNQMIDKKIKKDKGGQQNKKKLSKLQKQSLKVQKLIKKQQVQIEQQKVDFQQQKDQKIVKQEIEKQVLQKNQGRSQELTKQKGNIVKEKFDQKEKNKILSKNKKKQEIEDFQEEVESENDYSDDGEEDSENFDDEEELDLTKKKDDFQEDFMGDENYYKNEGDEGSENEEEDFDEDYDKIDVKFNFYDPNENQYHSVKNLLNSYLDGVSFKSVQLADLIVNQVQIGTMMGIDDQEEEKKQKDVQVAGFITTLGFSMYKDQEVIKEIAEFIKDKSRLFNQQKHKELLSILETKKVGLLVNERIINLSPLIVPTLHQQFLQDLEWLKKEDPQEYKNFDFEYLVCLSKIFKETKNAKVPGFQEKNQTSGTYSKDNNKLENFIYQKFEDYKIIQKSQIFFKFQAKSSRQGSGITNISQQQETKEKETCFRTISIIKTKDYFDLIPTLQEDIIDEFSLTINQ